MKFERTEWLVNADDSCVCPVALTLEGVVRRGYAVVPKTYAHTTVDMETTKRWALQKMARELFTDALFEAHPELFK